MTHVLITRPLPAAQQLADQLEKKGLVPVVAPMYTFSEREPGIDVDIGGSGPVRKLAVFTSPRAVQFGIQYLPSGGLSGLELAAVGSATAAALKASGFIVDLQADSGYTSEDLLQLESLAVAPGEAVIFCAPGGREKLADGLVELGWNVEKALVYERVQLPVANGHIETLRSVNDLISVWTSNSAVDMARETLPGDVWKKVLAAPALVISTRMQHHLKAMGATNIEVSKGPGNPDLLQAIMRIHEQQAKI